MRPTLRQIEYAVALADSLSFRRAAIACSVSQPGLSAQIKELEQLLGVRLFERDKRRVLITPAGERILESARRVLSEVDGLVASSRALNKPFAGTLRLGVIPTIAPYLLPRVMPALHERYPELRLLLREGETKEIVALAERGTLDLLLVALEAELGSLESAALFEDAFVVAMPVDHPSSRRKALRARDLAGEQVLLLADGHCLRGQTAPICERAGACEIGDFRATSLSTLVQMVAGGVGITLLPRMALEVELSARRGLVARELADVRPARTIGLAWRRSSPHKEAFLRVAEVFQQAGRRSSGGRAKP